VTTETPYSSRFYEGLAQGSLNSARVYLGHLFGVWTPASVVDLGCGRGAWLAAAGERGVRRLVGVDGAWNQGETLQDAAIEFHAADLEREVTLAERFDLALSLEVAEHIQPDSSDRFVASLAGLSDALLFGAAFVGQPGTHHVNTRPHSFWARRFLNRGYALFDLFRPKFWSDDRVEPWYRQNTFLYVRPEHPLFAALIARGHEPASDARFVDAIHPWLYEKVLREVVRLRGAAPAAAPAAPAPERQAAAPARQPPPGATVVQRQRVGRNDPCPCGSGKRFKHCHGRAA
jgi:SAM-dependent methyltransferase